MGYHLDLSMKSMGDITVLSIAGDVTAVTGQSVEEACNSEKLINSNHILMNFNSDCYFNSGGIAFLIGITLNSKERGQTVSISGVSDHFKKIFNMVGLTRCAEIYDRVDDVIRTA
jgi:anti-anti-sigma factor